MGELLEKMIHSIFSEYGLAVLVLIFTIAFCFKIIHVMNRERIRDREERLQMLKRHTEAQAQANEMIKQNTLAITTIDSSLQYIRGIMQTGAPK